MKTKLQWDLNSGHLNAIQIVRYSNGDLNSGKNVVFY